MKCTRREQDTRSPPHSIKYWPLFDSHGPHALMMSDILFGCHSLSAWLLLRAHVLRSYVSEQRGIIRWGSRFMCSSCAHCVGQDSFLRCWHGLSRWVEILELFLRTVIAVTQALHRVAMPDWCDICVLQGLAEGINHLLWSTGPLDNHSLSFLLHFSIGAIDWL